MGVAVFVSSRGSNRYAEKSLGDCKVYRSGYAALGEGCSVASDRHGSGGRAIALCIGIGNNEACACIVARAAYSRGNGKIRVSAVGCGNSCRTHQLVALAAVLCDLVAACRVYEIMVLGLCCACRAVVSIDGSSLRFVAGGVAVIYLCVADNRMGLCGLTVVEVLSECSAEHIRQFTGGNVFHRNSDGVIVPVIYRRNVVIFIITIGSPGKVSTNKGFSNRLAKVVAISDLRSSIGRTNKTACQITEAIFHCCSAVS